MCGLVSGGESVVAYTASWLEVCQATADSLGWKGHVVRLWPPQRCGGHLMEKEGVREGRIEGGRKRERGRERKRRGEREGEGMS